MKVKQLFSLIYLFTYLLINFLTANTAGVNITSPKNNCYTKKNIKQQIYNNFYNIYSPSIKNNINIAEVNKLKDFEVAVDNININPDCTKNTKNVNYNDRNNIMIKTNFEHKKSLSAIKNSNKGILKFNVNYELNENKNINSNVNNVSNESIVDNLLSENKILSDKVISNIIAINYIILY